MYPIYKFIGEENICKDVPIAFPPQSQDRQPGFEYIMNPLPISENPNYVGSGKLKDKVAVIAGGDSGIGRAVAYSFAKEGADIAILYFDEHRDANDTKARIENIGRKCMTIPCDLKQECIAKKAVQNIIECFGKIDTLVNLTGVQFLQNSILDITEEQLDITFKTNIYSFFFMIKAVLPHLKRGITIINTTSITAYRGNPQLIDYSCTKGAITTLTRSLAMSLVDKGMRVNGIAPGPIWTPLIPASYPPSDIKTFGTYTSKVPMNRAGQPFEVTTSYVFLASDDSSYMTGQILHPKGGEIVNG